MSAQPDPFAGPVVIAKGIIGAGFIEVECSTCRRRLRRSADAAHEQNMRDSLAAAQVHARACGGDALSIVYSPDGEILHDGTGQAYVS